MPSTRELIKESRQKRVNWLIVLTMLGLVLILSLPAYERFDLTPLTEGRPSPVTLTADRHYRVLDSHAVEVRKRKAVQNVTPVFMERYSARNKIKRTMKQELRKLREGELTLQNIPAPQSKKEWNRLFSISSNVVEFLLDQGIIKKKAVFDRFDPDRVGKFQRMENPDGGIQQPASRKIGSLRNQFIEINEVIDQMSRTLDNLYGDYRYKKVILALLERNVEPTVFFQKEQYQKQVQQASESVRPVYREFEKGEPIIRAGEQVTPSILSVLKRINDKKINFRFVRGLSSMLIAVIGVIFVYFYLKLFNPNVLNQTNKLGLMALMVVIQVAICKFVDLFFGTDIKYAIPLAAPVILIALMIESQLAVLVTVLLAFLTVSFFKFNFEFFALLVLGSMAGIFSIRRVERRSALLETGLIVAGVQFISLVTFYGVRTGTVFNNELGLPIMWVLVNGAILVPFTVIGLLPYLENLFRITTNFQLIELADLNHPLLRDLFERAPGTYQHSIMLSNLCERAAQEIGANALLVRVGAYYHDLGKAEIPEYFIENQGEEKNPHDELKPTLSASILKSHVKKGVERAEEEGIPEEIIDLIKQHHGTTRMQFFYHKALEDGEDNVSEDEFQYPGPPPQTREAGICMLGDSVEAASRTLDDPSPSSIRDLVEGIVNDKFTEGQLNECPLTLKDLNTIVETFTRVLASVHHHRVEYPDEEDTERLEELQDESLEVVEEREVEFENGDQQSNGGAD
ncbi:MAG: HD family phosphohydrolase [bacterium]